MAAALDYVESIGLKQIAEHERNLTAYALEELKASLGKGSRSTRYGTAGPGDLI